MKDTRVKVYNAKGRHIVVYPDDVERKLEEGWTLEPPGSKAPDQRVQRIAEAVREMDRKARESDEYRESNYTSTGLPDLDTLREETGLLYPGEDIGAVTAKDRSLALGWIDHQ